MASPKPKVTWPASDVAGTNQVWCTAFPLDQAASCKHRSWRRGKGRCWDLGWVWRGCRETGKNHYHSDPPGMILQGP